METNNQLIDEQPIHELIRSWLESNNCGKWEIREINAGHSLDYVLVLPNGLKEQTNAWMYYPRIAVYDTDVACEYYDGKDHQYIKSYIHDPEFFNNLRKCLMKVSIPCVYKTSVC